jgi:hypothetical protein
MRASTDVVADQLDRDHQARTDGARQEHGRDETSGVPTETAADAGERLLTIKDKPVSCKTVGSAYEVRTRHPPPPRSLPVSPPGAAAGESSASAADRDSARSGG